jgi:DNA-binding NarL/FixJ family response regulator
MHDPNAIKVGLVGSQTLWRDALSALLSAAEGFEITLSIGAAPILPALETASVDVMVFHLHPRTPTSVPLLQELPRVAVHTRAIVLACLTDVAEYAEAVERGAMGIVSCEETGAVLLKAIRKVHAGEFWLDRARTAGVVTRLTRGLSYKDPDTVKIASLTPRQREIVSLVAEGLTNKQLADRLFITEATARNHMTAILDKLELSDKFQLAVYAFRHGLAGQPLPVARISSAALST